MFVRRLRSSADGVVTWIDAMEPADPESVSDLVVAEAYAQQLGSGDVAMLPIGDRTDRRIEAVGYSSDYVLVIAHTFKRREREKFTP
jgi:hypothetical protein